MKREKKQKVKNIYEFGAGTGINLIELSKIFPKNKIYGSDFVKSAVDLLKLVSKNNDLNLNAFKFDMSKYRYEGPWGDLEWVGLT